MTMLGMKSTRLIGGDAQDKLHEIQHEDYENNVFIKTLLFENIQRKLLSVWNVVVLNVLTIHIISGNLKPLTPDLPQRIGGQGRTLLTSFLERRNSHWTSFPISPLYTLVCDPANEQFSRSTHILDRYPFAAKEAAKR